MILIKTDEVSAAGSLTKPNEDRSGFSHAFAFVVDGATGKTDKRFVAHEDSSDAAWLAQTVKEYLLKNFSPSSDICLEFYNCAQYMKQCFDKAALSVPQYPWEFPYASLVMAVVAGDQLVLGSLGDCTALIQMTDGSVTVWGGDPRHLELDRQIISLAGERSLGLNLPLNEKREKVIGELRQNISQINQPGGYGSLSLAYPDPRQNVRKQSIPLASIDSVLLMSDGLYALVDDYAYYTDAGLTKAVKTKGLVELVSEARSIEESDPQGLNYPRLKKSDDATGLYLKLGF